MHAIIKNLTRLTLCVIGCIVLLGLWLLGDPPQILELIQRQKNPGTLIDPNEPKLTPIIKHYKLLLKSLQEQNPDKVTYAEAAVAEFIEYQSDFHTYGTWEHLPTTKEVLSKGKDDCDGMAIIAAAILKATGERPRLMVSSRHMWVSLETPKPKEEHQEKESSKEKNKSKKPAYFDTEKGWISEEPWILWLVGEVSHTIRRSREENTEMEGIPTVKELSHIPPHRWIYPYSALGLMILCAKRRKREKRKRRA